MAMLSGCTGEASLVDDATTEERTRCCKLVEWICEQTAEKQMENACRFPRSGEKFRHGSMVAFELSKELSAAIQEDK